MRVMFINSATASGKSNPLFSEKVFKETLSSDGSKILKEGTRVKDIKVNGVPIVENNYYKVATNDFVLQGGDGFTQFKKAKNVIKTNVLVQDVIINYIKQNTPVFLDVTDKINLLNYNTNK